MGRIIGYVLTFIAIYGIALVGVKIFAGLLTAAMTSPVGAIAVFATIAYIYWSEKKKKDKEKR